MLTARFNRTLADPGGVRCPPIVGAVVAVAGIGLFVAAFVVVIVGNGGRIRYTADSVDTIPVWHPLLPVVIGVALALLISPRPPSETTNDSNSSRLTAQAVALLMLAAAFTVLLCVLGPAEPHYTLLKLSLLFVAPMVLFAVTSDRAVPGHVVARRADRFEGPLRRQLRPVLPAIGWVACYLVLSTTRPGAELKSGVPALLAVLAVGFVINALLEEFFYRRWLQTRWVELLGSHWPAIVLASLAWASWHIAIQGGGDFVADMANAIVNQGVTGLFLGLLWARYKVMWPLLVLHGLMNANPLLIW